MSNAYNPKNERIKYQYRIYLTNVKQRDFKTIIAVMKHLHEYETLREFANFSDINENAIHAYVESLLSKNLSLSYIDHNLKTLKDFYYWLERQKGYKSKINYNIIEYFNLTHNQRKEARALEYQKSHKIEDIYKVIRSMPSDTIEERRNKAMISLQLLCGLRVSELRTVKLKNLIYDDEAENWMIYASPKDMDIKFAKTRNAYFMPYGEDIKENVLNWYEELKKMGFKDKSPLFPKIPHRFNQLNLLEPNIVPEQIKSNTTISSIFRKAFEAQNLPHYRVHSFRHSIVRWSGKKQPEFFNAVRQSLGHSDIKTTFTSYGALQPSTVGKILKKGE